MVLLALNTITASTVLANQNEGKTPVVMRVFCERLAAAPITLLDCPGWMPQCHRERRRVQALQGL